ncbi:MAG: CoA-binding protein [Herminiimonas sp.]|nr:CoA-binding protein [Herminiimonas sp.]MDB5852234.1 CoA-binding protein [Herminiimonas sp.]
MPDQAVDIPDILKRARTIAVVGLSANPERPSNEVASYLQQHGFRIVPVNPSQAGQRILNEVCHASLTDAAAALKSTGVQIDVVDCFRRSEAIGPIADEAISIGAWCLWMQLGVINEAAAQKARDAELIVVMDRCMKIEHMRVA